MKCSNTKTIFVFDKKNISGISKLSYLKNNGKLHVQWHLLEKSNSFANLAYAGIMFFDSTNRKLTNEPPNIRFHILNDLT